MGKPFAQLFLIIGIVFVVLFVLEAFIPLRTRKRMLISRLIVNGCLSVVAVIIGSQIVAPTGLSLAGWASEKPFGLIHVAPAPPLFQALLGFLLMDLSFYYWHLANHKVPLLWRFHNVHHIDPDLDVSTAVRFHFGEVFLSTGFRALQVVLIGVSPLVYVIYELVFQSNTLFHHSNLRVPLRLERILNKLLVTPRMHGIHHSEVMGETNSNYSVVFPWWDRLHRSLQLNVPQSAIVVGIPAYQDPRDNTLWNALWLPFRKQRDYWSRPDGSRPSRDAALVQSKRTILAD